MNYWYKFEDLSCGRGGNACGFSVVLSLDYIRRLKNEVKWEVIQKRVSEIKYSGEDKIAGLDISPHPEIKNLFWSVNCQEGRFGLDFDRDNFRIEDPKLECAYSTHNCVNPEVRHQLEKGFFTWAQCVEAFVR